LSGNQIENYLWGCFSSIEAFPRIKQAEFGKTRKNLPFKTNANLFSRVKNAVASLVNGFQPALAVA